LGSDEGWVDRRRQRRSSFPDRQCMFGQKPPLARLYLAA
jgi:hypothetical protein